MSCFAHAHSAQLAPLAWACTLNRLFPRAFLHFFLFSSPHLSQTAPAVLRLNGPALTMTNSTIAHCTALAGTGGAVLVVSPQAPVALRDVLLRNNSCGYNDLLTGEVLVRRHGGRETGEGRGGRGGSLRCRFGHIAVNAYSVFPPCSHAYFVINDFAMRKYPVFDSNTVCPLRCSLSSCIVSNLRRVVPLHLQPQQSPSTTCRHLATMPPALMLAVCIGSQGFYVPPRPHKLPPSEKA